MTALATERVVQFVEPTLGYWVIPGERGDLKLASGLLSSMTQDKAGNYVSKEGFKRGSLIEQFNVFSALYDLRGKGGDVESARQFIQKSMRSSGLGTQTRISYMPEGLDVVLHDYGRNSQKESRALITGLDREVVTCLSKDASLALTGKTPEQVSELFSYINRTSAFVWRLNKRPFAFYDECVAWFIAGLNRAYLFCDRGPQYSNSALGV